MSSPIIPPFTAASAEGCDPSGRWRRSHGNGHRGVDESELMRRRHTSINDSPIQESERRFTWGR